MQRKILYLFLAACFAFFLFFKLGKYTLWQDEADLAMVSKGILQTGLPSALVDGKFLTQWQGMESNENYLWTFNPWLEPYLRAASFALFGVSEWSARIPFTLIGFISLLPLGLAFFRWSQSHTVTWLSLFLLIFNPWVILYCRQSKYYPIVFLAYGLMLLGYQKWEDGKKGGLLFGLGLILLFHCNYFTAALALLGFVICQPKTRLLVTTFATLLLFCLPFFLLGDFSERAATVSTFPTGLEYFKKLLTHIFYFNRQVAPLVLIPLWAQWRSERKYRFIFLNILVAWLGIGVFRFDVLRYNLQLIPLFCFLTAAAFVTLWQKNRPLGVTVFLLLWGSGFFSSLNMVKPEWIALKSYYFNDYKEPVKEIPKILQKHLKNGERVYLNNSQMVWQFYSDISLAYLVNAEKALPKNPPLKKEWTDFKAIDWWIGPHLVALQKGPYVSAEEILEEWKKEGYEYEIIDTDIPVSNWELNSPIRYKHFLMRFGTKTPTQDFIQLLHRVEKKS